MAGYTLGTLGTLLETIKETRHFRPQGTGETVEKWGEKQKNETLQGWVVKNMIVDCVEASVSRSRA